MPLTEPAPREPLHTRRIEIEGFARADGLWEIEAHLTDARAYAFDNAWRGRIEPGEFLHEMRLRLTLDDGLMVLAAEAVTENSPHQVCPKAAEQYRALVGLKVGPGWTRQAREAIAAPDGCTHLTELLAQMATVAYQTIFPVLSRRAKARGEARGEFGGRRGGRPALLDSCHAYRADGELARRLWPEFATEPR